MGWARAGQAWLAYPRSTGLEAGTSVSSTTEGRDFAAAGKLLLLPEHRSNGKPGMSRRRALEIVGTWQRDMNHTDPFGPTRVSLGA